MRRYRHAACFLAASWASLQFAFAQSPTSITTIAGGGVAHGILGTAACLEGPSSLRWHPTDGSLLISEAYDHRVRLLHANGTLVTIAGTGVSGYSGDGGSPLQARLSWPGDVAWHTDGSILIADSDNSRLRQVANGTIRTLVSGIYSLRHIEVVPADGSIIIVSTWGHKIYRFFKGVLTTLVGTGAEKYTPDGPVNASTTIHTPTRAVLNASDGSLWIAEWGAYLIRRLFNGTLTTVAGGGTGATNAASDSVVVRPQGLAFAPDGSLVFADNIVPANVRRISRSGLVSDVARASRDGYLGDGVSAATSAAFRNVNGLDVRASDGAVAIAELESGRVRLVKDGIITTIAGGFAADGGLATQTCVRPYAVALNQSDGSIFVAEPSHDLVRCILSNGTIIAVAGTGLTGFDGSGAATQRRLATPRDVAVNGSDLFIADFDNHLIRLVRGGLITTIAGTGFGGYSGDNGLATSAALKNPSGVTVNGSFLYIADSNNNRIRRIDAAGIITTVAGNGDGLAGYAGDGSIATSARFSSPWRVAVVGATLLIADSGNHVIRRIGANGIIETVYGAAPGASGSYDDGVPVLAARLRGPSDVALARDGVSVYICEAGCHKVRVVGSDGKLSAFAGSGTGTYNGDGEPATAYGLYSASSIEVDPLDGSVIIADWRNGRVRRVRFIGSDMIISSAVAALDDPACRTSAASSCSSVTATLIIRGSSLFAACSSGTLALSWTKAPVLSLQACNASTIIATFSFSRDPAPWLWHGSRAANVSVAVMRGDAPAAVSNEVLVVAAVAGQPPVSATGVLQWINGSTSQLRVTGRLLGSALRSSGSAIRAAAAGIDLPLIMSVPANDTDTLDLRLRYAADAWFGNVCPDCDAVVNVTLRLPSPRLVVGQKDPAPSMVSVPLSHGTFSLRVPRLRALRASLPPRVPRSGAVLPAGAVQLPMPLWTSAEAVADGLPQLASAACSVRVARPGATAGGFTAALSPCPTGDASTSSLVVPSGIGQNLSLSMVLGGGLLSVSVGTISYAPTGLESMLPVGISLPQAEVALLSQTFTRLSFALASPADDAHLYTRIRVGDRDCVNVTALPSGLTCNISLADLAAQLAANDDSRSLPVSFEWGGAWLRSQGDSEAVASSDVRLTVVARPTLSRVAPLAVAAGSELVVIGAGFCRGEPTGDCTGSTSLSVRVGSAPCDRVQILADFAATCTAPVIDPLTESGYPLLQVTVTNAARAVARDSRNITYPSSGHVVLSSVHDAEPIPAVYLPSDSTEPWLLPRLAVAVKDVYGTFFAQSVSCSLAPRTAGVLLLSADLNAVDLSAVQASSGRDSIGFGRFIVQAPFGTGNITVVASCSAPSDSTLSFIPLALPLAPLPLSIAVCASLPTATRSLGPLAAVRVALLPMLKPAGTLAAADACATGRVWSGFQPLPRISCSVSASAVRPSAATPILQDSTAEVNLTSGTAEFGRLRLGGEVKENYTMTLRCAVGSLVIPNPISTTVLITGCAAGSQPSGSLCEPCAADAYSDGGQAPCRKCPLTGVSCSSGILRALPGFYRPPSHVGLPLVQTSELHACPIPSRCIVADSGADTAAEEGSSTGTSGVTRAWRCADGTTGPLCAVCDEAAGYAAIGGECVKCACNIANVLAVVLLVTVAVLGITFVTLLKRKAAVRGEGGRSGDSIALRILLTHVQAAGSLRAFQLSGGEMYRRATVWMDVLSPAVLAQGPTQCVVRPSFPAIFWSTLAAPLLACGLSMLVLVAAEGYDYLKARRAAPTLLSASSPSASNASMVAGSASSTRRRAAGRAGGSSEGRARSCLHSAAVSIASVWATGAPPAVLLFLLSLAYMPMLGTSLSVFQCTQPIDGVRYVTSDVRLRCEASGQYIAMAVAAGVTLIVVGAGFPLLIVMRLRRAGAAELANQRFRAVWSFLFDGYRGSLAAAAVVPSASSAIGKGGKGTSARLQLLRSRSGDTADAETGASQALATANPLLLRSRTAVAAAEVPYDASTLTEPKGIASIGRRQSQPQSAMPDSIASQPQSWLIAQQSSSLAWESVVLARKFAVVMIARLVSELVA